MIVIHRCKDHIADACGVTPSNWSCVTIERAIERARHYTDTGANARLCKRCWKDEDLTGKVRR